MSGPIKQINGTRDWRQSIMLSEGRDRPKYLLTFDGTYKLYLNSYDGRNYLIDNEIEFIFECSNFQELEKGLKKELNDICWDRELEILRRKISVRRTLQNRITFFYKETPKSIITASFPIHNNDKRGGLLNNYADSKKALHLYFDVIFFMTPKAEVSYETHFPLNQPMKLTFQEPMCSNEYIIKGIPSNTIEEYHSRVYWGIFDGRLPLLSPSSYPKEFIDLLCEFEGIKNLMLQNWHRDALYFEPGAYMPFETLANKLCPECGIYFCSCYRY